MSRPIKFRGWLKRERLMVPIIALYPNGCFGVSIQDSGPFRKTPEECEPMQFIGLRDRNGKDIYEGDIVRGSNSGRPYVVIYQAPKFILKQKLKSGYSKTWAEFILHPDENQFEEIIGNIYETPELLKC